MEKENLFSSVSSLINISERLSFFSELEKQDKFPSSWLAFVRDIIPSGTITMTIMTFFCFREFSI